jgi:hypothetical protein
MREFVIVSVIVTATGVKSQRPKRLLAALYTTHCTVASDIMEHSPEALRRLIALVAFDNSWVNRDSKELLYIYIPNTIMHNYKTFYVHISNLIQRI